MTTCPHCGQPINPAALLRSIESEARKETSRRNGAKGGRPPKKKGTSTE